MCGAEDCPRCRPENFHCGVFIDDTEAEEEEEEEDAEDDEETDEDDEET